MSFVLQASGLTFFVARHLFSPGGELLVDDLAKGCPAFVRGPVVSLVAFSAMGARITASIYYYLFISSFFNLFISLSGRAVRQGSSHT